MEQKCPKCGQQVEDEATTCPRCRYIMVREDHVVVEEFSDDIIPNGAILADEYKVVKLLGRGGAGRVYEARQITLQNMPVALKVLHPDINQNETSIALLKKEVIISRELTHENIIKVYSLEKHQGRHFLVMEHVKGRNLSFILRKLGKLSAKQFGPILLQVCDALEYAHGRGIIHLDIKPGNILVGTAGNVKLCDFGIARMALGNVTTATQRLVTGSMGYMPPEQYSGRKFVTNQSDVYALGATVYHVLTGHVPVGSYDRSKVPQCVLRAMAPNLSDRFESVKDFRRAFIQETRIGPVEREEVRTLIQTAPDAASEPQSRPLSPARRISDTITVRTDSADSHDVAPPELRPNAPRINAEADAAGKLSAKAPKAVIAEGPGPERTARSADQAIVTAQSPAADASRRRRNLILVAGAAVVAVTVLIAAAVLYKKHRVPAVPGVSKVQVAKYDWHDAQRRNLEVSANVYRPIGSGGSLPVVIFSLPAGGSQNTGEYLGRYWASHGYISAFIQHKGVDEIAKRDSLSTGMRFLAAVHQVDRLRERIRDAHFAVDQLERMNRDDKEFKGGIDLERIGMAGNAQGALTTLAVAGASDTLPPGREKSFVDHRIKAAIAMSSLPVSSRRKPIVSGMMSGIKIPCLYVCGSMVPGPGGEITVEQRRLAFDAAGVADQYLILFKNADHAVFAGRQPDGEKAPETAAIHDLICVSSTAFWDAYLKGDAKAREWLSDGGMESKLGDLGTLEKKLVK